MAIGEETYVWFKKSNGFLAKMVVSSVSYGRFTARFKSEADWSKSEVEVNYGQTDNDILVDMATGEPVDKTALLKE